MQCYPAGARQGGLKRDQNGSPYHRVSPPTSGPGAGGNDAQASKSATPGRASAVAVRIRERRASLVRRRRAAGLWSGSGTERGRESKSSVGETWTNDRTERRQRGAVPPASTTESQRKPKTTIEKGISANADFIGRSAGTHFKVEGRLILARQNERGPSSHWLSGVTDQQGTRATNKRTRKT